MWLPSSFVGCARILSRSPKAERWCASAVSPSHCHPLWWRGKVCLALGRFVASEVSEHPPKRLLHMRPAECTASRPFLGGSGRADRPRSKIRRAAGAERLALPQPSFRVCQWFRGLVGMDVCERCRLAALSPNLRRGEVPSLASAVRFFGGVCTHSDMRCVSEVLFSRCATAFVRAERYVRRSFSLRIRLD